MSLLKIGRKGMHNNASPLDEKNIAPLARDQLGISIEAANFIKAIAKKDPMLRVAVQGGGCSGFSIHYELCKTVHDRDLVFSNDGVQVIIDQKSLAVLGGATLHCRDYLGSKSFILVNNPNAKQCSCGQSFSL